MIQLLGCDQKQKNDNNFSMNQMSPFIKCVCVFLDVDMTKMRIEANDINIEFFFCSTKEKTNKNNEKKFVKKETINSQWNFGDERKIVPKIRIAE